MNTFITLLMFLELLDTEITTSNFSFESKKNSVHNDEWFCLIFEVG